MEHIPGALLLHEIMWDSAHSWRRLQVRQNTYFCTVDNGDCIDFCVQSSIYEYGPVELTAPCSSWAFSLSISKFVLLDNFCSCCYYNYIASLTSYWTKLYCKLAACSLYHTGVMLEQKYSIKLICQYGYVSSCKVQTYIQRARKRCDMDCISDLRV